MRCAKLTPDECFHIIPAGECFYCGSFSSFSSDSIQEAAPPLDQLLLSAMLGIGNVLLLCQALFISGAKDNLLDGGLPVQRPCLLETLPIPLTATALGGRFITLVTHRTTKVTLIISRFFFVERTKHSGSCCQLSCH